MDEDTKWWPIGCISVYKSQFTLDQVKMYVKMNYFDIVLKFWLG
jgi:hypothetical protein